MTRLHYTSIERLAAQHDVGFERGRDQDGPFIRLSGFLSDIEAVEQRLPPSVHVTPASTGHYLRAW